MDTYLDLQTEVAARLQVADNSTLFTPDRIRTIVLNAYKLAGNSFLWAETQLAMEASTQANVNYYDYPDQFLTNSIEILKINGKTYDKKAWQDFDQYRSDYPNDTTAKLYADHKRQWHVFPTPTSNGDWDVEIHGHIEVTTLLTSNDKTIFSDGNEGGNEAVVKIAVGTATNDENMVNQGIGILANIYSLQKNRQQFAQRLNRPQFSVPDFFRPKFAPSGNFNYRTISNG
jgi:hypothetical protein